MNYSYSGAVVSLAKDTDRLDTAIAWAFGSGVQAITPVIERNGRWVEHRVSWYREGNRLSLTPGHDPEAQPSLEDSLGIIQSDMNAKRCFGCHQPVSKQPGVHCQACHGEGEAHRTSPSKGNIKRDRSVALCAPCHRSPDQNFVSPMPEIEDPRSIRFAPVGFQASRCFQKSKGFTCVTCHDPHGEATRPAAVAVCRSCHSSFRKASHPKSSDCLACHMQRSSPIPGLTFTDHRIRVY